MGLISSYVPEVGTGLNEMRRPFCPVIPKEKQASLSVCVRRLNHTEIYLCEKSASTLLLAFCMGLCVGC